MFGHLHAHNVHEKIYLKGDIQAECNRYNKYEQRETLEVRSIKTTINTNVNGTKQIRSTVRNIISSIGNRIQKNEMQFYHIVNWYMQIFIYGQNASCFETVPFESKYEYFNDTIRNHFITNANIRTNDVSLHC